MYFLGVFIVFFLLFLVFSENLSKTWVKNKVADDVSSVFFFKRRRFMLELGILAQFNLVLHLSSYFNCTYN